MFEYFPQSVATYWLNKAVVHATSIGATLGDVNVAAQPYREYYLTHRTLFETAPTVSSDHDGAAQSVPAALVGILKAGASIWTDSWLAAAENLIDQGKENIDAGHDLAAGNKFRRAAALMTAVEWSMNRGDRKTEVFLTIRDLVRQSLDLANARYEDVKVPFANQELDAWFFKSDISVGNDERPTLLAYNGFHSSMDWYVQTRFVENCTRRGVNVLVFDHPGSGAARHLRGLPLTPYTEQSAGAAVDYLQSRNDVCADRIGVLGVSFGGYHAIRAVAYETRLAYAYCWGGWYYWPPEEVFAGGDPDAEAGSSIEMADLEDLYWITGTNSKRSLYEVVTSFHLKDVCPDVRRPIFVMHGENDAQVTSWHAHQLIEKCVNAPAKELKIIHAGEGGTQHCHTDNLDTPLHLLCDKIADTLRTPPAHALS